MWLIAGTVPDDDFGLESPLTAGEPIVAGDRIVLPSGRAVPVARGTAALAATAIAACKALGAAPPRLLLAGDTGTGKGSRNAYDWLAANLSRLARESPLRGITFHYFYPDVDGHNRVLMAIETLKSRPVLVADAGFMYVAKMSGYAASYDLFTPDAGELAFLADELAPHPFYTRGFLLATEEDVPTMITRALKHGNSPANLIVKGARDHVLCDGEIRAVITEPSRPAMECVGGTGDLVAGLATAWLAAGTTICASALAATRAARLLAQACDPTPATQIAEFLPHIAAVVKSLAAESDCDTFYHARTHI